MNTRRKLVIALGVGAAAPPLGSFAQQRGKVWRIGVLHAGSRKLPGGGALFRGFFEGLRDLGYVEGRNLAVHWEFAENDVQRLPELAVLLLKENVDLIAAGGTPAVRAAQQATTTLPIVALRLVDPVGSGFAASLARPGANITGTTNLAEETRGKRWEILAEIAPRVRRVALLVNPINPGSTRFLLATEELVRKIGKEFVVAEVGAADQLSAAFEQMARDRAGALMVAEDTLLNFLTERIAVLALQYKLPSMFSVQSAIGYGGLVSYAANFASSGRRASTIAAKIFQGAKPADLPFQQPTEFDLTVNLKTAKALGITIPQSVLVRATRVIE
jgi:putative tryptophan/tyrosine transport system substrate-binding protein